MLRRPRPCLSSWLSPWLWLLGVVVAQQAVTQQTVAQQTVAQQAATQPPPMSRSPVTYTGAGQAAHRAPSPEVPLSQLMVRQWTTDDGLPSNSVTEVVASQDGFLWLTSFAGLARFDGVAFRIFDQQDAPALSGNGFASLYEDPQGTLWLGTQGDGPWTFEAGRLRPFGKPRSPVSEILALQKDRQGNLWAAVDGAGVVRYREFESEVIDHPSLAGGVVSDILQTQDGAVWFATQARGVVRWQDGDYTSYAVGAVGAPGEKQRATSLAEAADGSLWVGLSDGVARLDGGRAESISELAGVSVSDLMFDAHGSLWVACDQGLMRWLPASRKLDLLERWADGRLENLRTLALDHEGSLWLASGSQGLFQIQQGKFISFGAQQGLDASRANTISEDTLGEILVGTDRGAYRVVDAERVIPVDLGFDLAVPQVMDFFRDRQQRLWISTYSGVVLWDGPRRRHLTLDDGLPDLLVRWVRQDRTGRLWAGTVDGVVRWSEEEGRFLEAVELGPSRDSFAFSFTETDDGRLLFGSREGLLILAPDGSRRLYGTSRELPASLVFNARPDGLGNIWLATPSGLIRLSEDGAITVLDRRGGLPVDSVFDVVEDESGFVWLSSVLGPIRLAKGKLDAFMDGSVEAVASQVFDERDGMLEAELTGARRMLKTEDGRLWFPTLEGVASLHPDHLRLNDQPPPVYITRLQADGDAIDLATDVVLEPGQRRVSFEVAVLSFRAPSRVRLRYRLEGFDPVWSEAEAERRISYTNLKPKSYTLRVQATNNDGIWNEQGATLRFRLEPRFYETYVFMGLCALVALLAIVGGHRWRVHAVQRRNTLLERDAIERSRLIDQLAVKNRELELFAYTASHDLKSPLVTIEGFLGLLEKDALAGNRPRMERDLERIRGAIRSMGQLLEGLLEVSRIGRQDDAFERLELSALAAQAVELLSSQIQAAEAEVRIASDLPSALVSASRLSQVFQNLIANALKFRGSQAPRILVGWRPGDESGDGGAATADPVIYVQDNGCGIPAEFHQKVFGLFDRLDSKAEGSGLGLAIVQRVVEVHGGRVWVESGGEGQGATFCFTLGPGCWTDRA